MGGGTFTMLDTNTYSGPTTINLGELVVNGSLAGPATVNSGGALAGTGSLTSVMIGSGGHLAPGNSPGTLTLSGSLTLTSGAMLDYELGTLLASDEVLMPTGLLVLSGQQFSDFNFTPLSGFGPGTYMLIDAGAVSGVLGANTSGTINGMPASIAIQGNDLVLNVVPEPSTISMLLAASLGLIAFARSRQRRSSSRLRT
jgi:autotransporter-associated beta strand protein